MDIDTSTTLVQVRRARRLINFTEKIPIFDMGDGVVLVSKTLLNENLLPHDNHVLQAGSLLDELRRNHPKAMIRIPQKGWEEIVIEYKKWTSE